MGEIENLKQTLNSPEIQENPEEIQMGFGDNRRRNLCLRENPKKSWWVSSNSMEQGNFCEQCGKGFKSDKALFGHMRLHSKRKPGSVKKIADLPKPLKKKRSQRRYNKISSCSYNSNPCSSSSMTVNFDCVDQELEEIAVCLLMLGNGGFCSFYAPVDKPFSDGEYCSVKMDPSNEVHDNVMEVMDSSGFCGFDCGFSKSHQENPEPGASVGVQTELHNDVLDNVVVDSCDSGYECVSFIVETGFDRAISKSNRENHDPGPSSDCVKKPAKGVQIDTESKLQQNVSTGDCLEKPVMDCGIENQAELYDTIKIKDAKKNDSKVAEIPVKKYICKSCSRSFNSGQSLGGHRLHCPIPKRYRTSIPHSRSCFETSIQTELLLVHDQKELLGSENRAEKLGNDKKSKNGDKYKCLHCYKSFNSGQSLGGHMRAHLKWEAKVKFQTT